MYQYCVGKSIALICQWSYVDCSGACGGNGIMLLFAHKRQQFNSKIQFGNFYSAQILVDASSEVQNPNRNQLNVESQSVSRQQVAESPRN